MSLALQFLQRFWASRRSRPIRKLPHKPLKYQRLCLEILEDRLAPAGILWDAGGDGSSWSDRFNWSGDVVPDSTADVAISNLGATVVVVNGSQPAIHSLDNHATLRILSDNTNGSGHLTVADGL